MMLQGGGIYGGGVGATIVLKVAGGGGQRGYEWERVMMTATKKRPPHTYASEKTTKMMKQLQKLFNMAYQIGCQGG